MLQETFQFQEWIQVKLLQKFIKLSSVYLFRSLVFLERYVFHRWASHMHIFYNFHFNLFCILVVCIFRDKNLAVKFKFFKPN